MLANIPQAKKGWRMIEFKKMKILIRPSILSPLAAIILWELFARSGSIDPFFLPTPTSIVRELFDLIISGIIFIHIFNSMWRMLTGFAIACISGVLIGLAMSWIRVVDEIVEPIVDLVRPVSPLAILPLAILWFGIGHSSKIFIIWYACFFPILLNTYAGVKGVSKPIINAARVLGANRFEMLFKVAVLFALPFIMVGVRISIGIGMIVIIASEMIAAKYGLGIMILTAQRTFNTKEVFGGIVVIALLGFSLDRGVKYLRKKLSPWYVEVGETQ